MPNSSTDPAAEELAALAARFLRELVAVLRADGGPTWRLLVALTSGRTAAIAFDGVRLRLTGRPDPGYDLVIERGEASDRLHFSTDARTVRDIIAGRITLDHALADGRVFVRGGLEELLGMYRLTISILVDSAVRPALRRLCIDFDETWPSDPPPAAPPPFQLQVPRFGHLVASVPGDVLRVEL